MLLQLDSQMSRSPVGVWHKWKILEDSFKNYAVQLDAKYQIVNSDRLVHPLDNTAFFYKYITCSFCQQDCGTV